MNLSTIVVSLVILGLFSWIILAKIRAKKAGKGGCGCGCENCANQCGSSSVHK